MAISTRAFLMRFKYMRFCPLISALIKYTWFSIDCLNSMAHLRKEKESSAREWIPTPLCPLEMSFVPPEPIVSR